MNSLKGDLQRNILGWIILVGFFGVLIYLLHLVHSGQSINDSTGSVFMLIGSMSTMAGTVVGYFYGTTVGSANKTATMMELAKQVPPTEVKPDAGAPKP